MLKIRFTQTGKKNDHLYRLVVKETRSKRDGNALEFLGQYQPNSPDALNINADRLNYWVKNGAQLSPSAREIVSKLLTPVAPKTEKTKSTPAPKPTPAKTKTSKSAPAKSKKTTKSK